MTTDYSTMTDAELNVAVAKALGWTCVNVGNPYGGTGFEIYRKDGSLQFNSWRPTEESTWEYLGKYTPFSTDANLALSLANEWKAKPETTRYWAASTSPETDGCKCYFAEELGGEWVHYVSGDQTTFARAICIAFLSAQEETK